MNKSIFTIAINTAREISRQPIFYCIACGGAFLILLSFSFTLFAFGEETRMIKEMGISTITICCLCLASLSATNAISREVEKGTILTLLSKPVSKESIILGKFLGILSVVFLTFMLTGIFLTVSVCIKDSREYHTGLLFSFTGVGYSTLFQLAFSFIPIAMICTIATAGSICLPMVSNLSCCIFVYIIGNLISFFQDLFRGNDGSFPWYVSFFSVIFPNLEGFNTIGMGSWSEKMSLSYIALSAVYAILYMIVIIILALEFFDKKECR